MTPSRRLFAVFGLAAVFSVTAQAWTWNWSSAERVSGNGDVTSEVRDVGAFDSVALSGGFNVTLRQGSGHRVEVRADRNLLPYLETRVVDGGRGRTLEIAPRRGYELQGTAHPALTIELPLLRAVSVAGAGTVHVEAMKAGGVDASIAGSGDIHFARLQAEHLALRVSGSGDIVAAGRCASAHVSIAGSGDVKAAELAANEVKVDIAGSGDAQVNAGRRLQVSIAGSGDVRYAGSPEVSSSVAGSGKVRRLD